MFATAELGITLDKTTYESEAAELRTELLRVQTALGHAGFPVLILLHGLGSAGRDETLNLLHEWLDTRYLDTQTYEPPSDEERQRPEFWRFWQWLPARGKIGLFLGSWYTGPLVDRVHDRISDADYARELSRANAFERTLADDGALIIKFWLHISKAEQKRRLRTFEKSRNQKFRASKRDWKDHARYAEFTRVAGRTLHETSTGNVPWTVVEATDWRYRNIAIARHIVERTKSQLERLTPKDPAKKPDPGVPDPTTVLDTLDLTKSLDKTEYESRLERSQGALSRLSRKLLKRGKRALVVFEGWDAAGKGGSIRRITRALDARLYRVIPVGAPTEEERAHHYLWRFWRHLPRRGRFTIYDRSWYGRVLVERVEGFAREEEWMRAYKEINDFEEQLAADSCIVVKFWLHISREEQLRRFEARKTEPWKQYKLTDEDYRNREKSNLYEASANDMIARTDTECARWTLVEAEDKRYARVKVLETLCQRLAEGL